MSYDPWYPKLNRGFFFVGDQQFYLFADKKTRTVSQALFYRWQLPVFPASVLSASINGVVISPEDLKIEDDYIRIRSTLFSSGDVADVTYTVQEISSGTIIQTSTGVALDPVAGSDSYYLDPTPTPGYPIILTDDSVSASGQEVHHEFDVDESTGEITFFDTIPTSGTFEYEGSVANYATVAADLNPANTGRVTGLLTVGLDVSPGIDPELY